MSDQPTPVSNNSTPIVDLVMQDMLERKSIGFNRYGTFLQVNNGRDAMRDLYEELLDACMYIRQVIEERK